MSILEDRYSRQIRFNPIGTDGQEKLIASRALICGCGALGSVIAERLGRSGVGNLRIVDRDWVEESNLQRQTLFNEQDALERTPKAVAATRTLKQINRHVNIEPVVEDVTHENMEEIAKDCDLILDGTDNFETRFLINDYCVKHRLPWVHGGCLGGSGQIMSYLPGETGCFRCLVPELPSREAMETCDSAGVLGPAIGIIASWQAAEALKILSGNLDAVCKGLIVVDCWQTDCRVIGMKPNAACQCCGHSEYPFLSGEIRTDSTVLCGKNAVQISHSFGEQMDFTKLGDSLSQIGEVKQNAFFVRLAWEDYSVTIFRDGRTIVEGTTDIGQAKSVIAQTIGS